MASLLDKLFGNKVKLVTVSDLWAPIARPPYEYVFHHTTDNKTIKDMFEKSKKFDYTVRTIKTKRTKKHISPAVGKYKEITKSK